MFILERHPLFQDNSRLAQLISQVTGSNEDPVKRVTSAQNLLEYTYDVSHLEVISANFNCVSSIKTNHISKASETVFFLKTFHLLLSCVFQNQVLCESISKHRL